MATATKTRATRRRATSRGAGGPDPRVQNSWQRIQQMLAGFPHAVPATWLEQNGISRSAVTNVEKANIGLLSRKWGNKVVYALNAQQLQVDPPYGFGNGGNGGGATAAITLPDTDIFLVNGMQYEPTGDYVGGCAVLRDQFGELYRIEPLEQHVHA